MMLHVPSALVKSGICLFFGHLVNIQNDCQQLWYGSLESNFNAKDVTRIKIPFSCPYTLAREVWNRRPDLD